MAQVTQITTVTASSPTEWSDIKALLAAATGSPPEGVTIDITLDENGLVATIAAGATEYAIPAS